jgi:hypothetical protein
MMRYSYVRHHGSYKIDVPGRTALRSDSLVDVDLPPIHDIRDFILSREQEAAGRAGSAVFMHGENFVCGRFNSIK